MGDKDAVIKSFLDTDLYKLTMQAAIHLNYPGVPCEFLLTNRTPTKRLNRAGYEWFLDQVHRLGELRFADEEMDYLREKLGYLSDGHFEWLQNVKLTPDKEIKIDVHIDDNGGYNLTITASGAWEVVTLYEIPILSLLSECYFRFVDTKWTIGGEFVAAYNEQGALTGSDFAVVERQGFAKGKKLLENGCRFSEFGTRRRRSYEVQHAVIKGLVAAANETTSGVLLGTSNVYLAKEFGIQPIGTIGHEWMMGIGAIEAMRTGEADYDAYLRANRIGMEKYLKCVGESHMGLALTDTYGTENYMKWLTKPFVDYYIGVRQDSGDPVAYAKMVSEWYARQGYVGDSKKVICFSDSLNVEKCLKLHKLCEETLEVVPTFGIGTNLTNDFDSEPMNIVMKLVMCGGGHSIKLSDNIGKNMGDARTVLEVKKRLGYVDTVWEEGDESKRWSK